MENFLTKIIDKNVIKDNPICYAISFILMVLFIFIFYNKINSTLLTSFSLLIFLGILSLSFFLQDKFIKLKDKKYNKKLYKEKLNNDIQTIKNKVIYIFSSEFKQILKDFLHLNILDNNSCCNYIINFNNDSISEQDNIILKLKEYAYDLNDNNLIIVNQKELTNEFLIYINPIIVKMYNDMEF